MVTATGEVSPIALEVSAVRKRFGEVTVLDSIDLRVPTGSLTAVLGPSGGGKTTLLRIIAGFEQPDLGTVTLGGVQVASSTSSMPPERRRVGIVPQEGALFPHLSVAGNVGFGLSRRSMSPTARAAQVAAMLDLVGLSGMQLVRPHELSGGQQHRVALARALAPNPSLVLLDEPFASLDAGLRAQLRDEVSSALRATGATAVMVTHDQLEALSIADQVAVLLDGRIAQVADPATLYQRPVSLPVAQFVGEATVVAGSVRGGRVECALGVFEARGVADGAATVLVRPEQVRLIARDGATGASADQNGVGEVQATVIGRQFYGHDAVVSVRLVAGELVTVRLHSSVLPAVGATVAVLVDGEPAVFSTAPATEPAI